MADGLQPAAGGLIRTIQGQSAATIDKERRISSALSIGMRIASAKFGGRGYRFWHFDANAGSGWNHDVDVPGSPLAFHAMADLHLSGMRRAAFFCDINGESIRQLGERLNATPVYAAASTLLPGDNEIGLTEFARAIREREKPEYAVGSVVVDPNGYWYRNAKGEGAPVEALTRFVKVYRKIDVVLNLNARTYRMQAAHKHAVLPPREVFRSLEKQHWLVARTQMGGDEFLLAIGRNTPTGNHKALGLHALDSGEGQHIMSLVEGHRQGRLL